MPRELKGTWLNVGRVVKVVVRDGFLEEIMFKIKSEMSIERKESRNRSCSVENEKDRQQGVSYNVSFTLYSSFHSTLLWDQSKQ